MLLQWLFWIFSKKNCKKGRRKLWLRDFGIRDESQKFPDQFQLKKGLGWVSERNQDLVEERGLLNLMHQGEWAKRLANEPKNTKRKKYFEILQKNMGLLTPQERKATIRRIINHERAFIQILLGDIKLDFCKSQIRATFFHLRYHLLDRSSKIFSSCRLPPPCPAPPEACPPLHNYYNYY